MKYLSLFSGIGGFELGIGKRAECIGFSEIDKYAIQIYKKHFNHKNYGDITKIIAKELPDFDLIVGGFPCQSFSIAGKRLGFKDTRGTLFFDIARIIKEKRPKYLLLENVKGLLSHDNGRTFRTILSTLNELGYDIQWQVLNSKNFGVPQNRERVFIVGHIRGEPRPKVFPIKGKDITVDKNIFFDESQWRREGKLREYKGMSPSLNTAGGGGHIPLTKQPFIKTVGLLKENEKPKGNYLPRERVLDGTKGARAVTTSQNQMPYYTDEMQIRKLTPIECERLQGFPDVEKYVIIEVCKNKNANGVEYNLNIKNQDNVAQSDVLIDCVENGVELHSQKKLLLSAKNVEKKNWYHQHIKIDDFVQLLVGINIIKEKITNLGEEEFHQNEQCLIHQKNGKKQENLFGKEMMQPVGDVENDLIILKELLKFTTLNHLDIKNLEQKLITLSLFVIRAIIGYIPIKILNQNIFTIGIKTKVGWTYGFSNNQRYKTLGNAVTVNVIREIISRLI